nr:ABC transporter permease [Rubellimicrobium sp. CFH 75288]
MGLIYHSTVRNVRKSHRNAVAGLLINVLQTVIFLAAFFFMFTLLGVRGSAIRGDFLLYLMTGIFLFMVHTKAVAAVVKAEGPTSPMMQHAPLTTAVTMASSALAALYLQILSAGIILFAYHVAWTPVTIDQPLGALAMLLLAWFSGAAVGVCFAALKPWFPEAVQIGASVYSRANMVASGKMFVANTLPGSLLVFFDWNPLFHTIDQARGYVFLNYAPRFSSWEYALWLSLILLVIGLLGESYTRRHASLSWGMGR